ncbi:MAG: radical SAM protein [Gammaproteobacteria bacterium]|nr:radical SAM protein [Gammaproteobacteria bacterium]MBU1440527.1 radical SAM protein [Gammaproteobacteria bacterium]MBU2285128.1 radical SAM protein [Gammaproteobacteria bacterium]MBU2410199.1 radical SAM protein [Gammaproteobacteria bacterium]
MFVLHCADAAGNPVDMLYDPHASTLTHMDGTPVIARDAAQREAFFTPATRISPRQPGRKHAQPSVLKIQLGLGCNYSCSYCSQASHVDSMAASSTADARAFIGDLDRWLQAPPSSIEFWGGEPLLYFKKLAVLVPELDRLFPHAEFSMVTNGSLLTPEIIDFIERFDIRIAVSHDGPAHRQLRGDDPFDDPVRGPLLRALWQRRKPHGRMAFNSVLTPLNSDPAAIRAWFVKTLGDESVATSLEGVVAVHDEQTLGEGGAWTPEQFRQLRENVAACFETGEALKIHALAERASGWLRSIVDAMPSVALGQKCGMDRSDHLAVDLHANVLTCQNTGAQGRHGLGSALDIDAVRLDTSEHWSNRDCCNHCPVLQLCGGSCMYLDGDRFAQSCDNEYHYGLGILDGTLRRSFGLRLLSIEGDVRRPQRRKTIPIQLDAVAPA